MTRPHPPARPHGELTEVFPGLWYVTGTVAMPGPLPVKFSRVMTVVREGERLVLLNSVRLDERGLAALDALGKVTDVIRLAGNHGADDPFYQEHYGARVWAAVGAPYMPGFSPKAPPYFEPDERYDASTKLPLTGATIHMFRSSPPEALLVLERDGGVMIAGDSLQNWESFDPYFNWLGGIALRLMGFKKAYNVGPGWLAQCKPPADDLLAVLKLPFAHVVPSHGLPVIGDAPAKFRDAIERAAARAAAT